MSTSAPRSRRQASAGCGRSSSPYHLSEQRTRSTSIIERVYETRMRRYGKRRTRAAQMPAQRAAGRLFRVNVALGTLAITSVLFVVTRLIETWRIGTGRAPDAVSVLGQRLSYPAANAGAVVIVALAGCGLIVLITAIRAAARELGADARFSRAMARQMPASVEGARVLDCQRVQRVGCNWS